MTCGKKTKHDELVALLTEIRDRLPEPEGVKDEPADITEEPPVGSQVTDCGEDVWERREGGWALWWPGRSGWIADLYEGELDPWSFVRNQAPLRFTTDEDRKRVGLPEPKRECCEPGPADLPGEPVEPDEALAKVLCSAWLTDDCFNGSDINFHTLARAAREHIEAEMGKCYAKEDATAHDRAEKAEAERDALRERLDALRADVENARRNPETLTRLLMRIADVLDRDDERTPQADPDRGD